MSLTSCWWGVVLGGYGAWRDSAEGAPSTVALSFALVLELIDPESEWSAYFKTLPGQVPNIVDFDGDLSLLEGSVWKERLSTKKQHMTEIFDKVLPPILSKVESKIGTTDLGEAHKQAGRQPRRTRVIH